MRSNSSTAEITSAYAQFKVAYSDRKAKEQEKYNNELATIRKKLVHGIQSCKELAKEIKIDVRDSNETAIQQIISELNAEGILARAEKEIDRDGPIPCEYSVSILITTKSLDDLMEPQKSFSERESFSVGKNQSRFFNENPNPINQNTAHPSSMRSPAHGS